MVVFACPVVSHYGGEETEAERDEVTCQCLFCWPAVLWDSETWAYGHGAALPLLWPQNFQCCWEAMSQEQWMGLMPAQLNPVTLRTLRTHSWTQEHSLCDGSCDPGLGHQRTYRAEHSLDGGNCGAYLAPLRKSE